MKCYDILIKSEESILLSGICKYLPRKSIDTASSVTL